MPQVTIDLGEVKGSKGDTGQQGIQGEPATIGSVISSESTNDTAAGCKAVYDFVVGLINGDF